MFIFTTFSLPFFATFPWFTFRYSSKTRVSNYCEFSVYLTCGDASVMLAKGGEKRGYDWLKYTHVTWPEGGKKTRPELAKFCIWLVNWVENEETCFKQLHNASKFRSVFHTVTWMKLPMKLVLASLSFSIPTNLHHPQSSLFLFVSTLSVNFSLSFFVLFCLFVFFSKCFSFVHGKNCNSYP